MKCEEIVQRRGPRIKTQAKWYVSVKAEKHLEQVKQYLQKYE